MGRCLPVVALLTVAGVVTAQPAPTTQPLPLTPTGPGPAASVLPVEERVQRLAELFGPAVTFGTPELGGRKVRVEATFLFDDPAEQRCFAAMNNEWQIRDGVLHGQGVGTSQIACLLPLSSDSCTVAGRLRSSHVFELCLLDPAASRFDGTRAPGRLHFGKMEQDSTTDWMELSSKERSLARLWGLRFDDGFQKGVLRLAGGELSADLSVIGGTRSMEGQILKRDLPPVVLVSVSGSVNNQVDVDALEITGSVDLSSAWLWVLTGQGREFWGSGRDVVLYYRARGQFRRLLLNGEVVARQTADPEIWWPTRGPLHRTTLHLRYSDVLAFDMAGVDDEAALHAVGVDQQTGRIVLATHPLTFDSCETVPDEPWYRGYQGTPHHQPTIARAQDSALPGQFRRVLDREFPGLPIAGPAVGPERRMFLKTTIR